MVVKELINILSKYNSDLEVVLSDGYSGTNEILMAEVRSIDPDDGDIVFGKHADCIDVLVLGS